MENNEHSLKSIIQRKFFITYTIQNELTENDKEVLDKKISTTNFNRIFLVLISTLGMQVVNLVSEFMPHEMGEYCYNYLKLSIVYIIFFTILLVVYVVLFLSKTNRIRMKAIYTKVFWLLLAACCVSYSSVELLDTQILFSYMILVFILAFIPLFHLREIGFLSIISTFIIIYNIIMQDEPFYLVLQMILANIACLIASQYLLNMYVKEYIMNIKLMKAVGKLEELSEIDPLTKLLNRRGVKKRINDLWRQSIEKECKLGLIIIDIDFFKNYNDKFGHVEGDNCLSKVATCLKQCTDNNHDIIARFGGEEFIFCGMIHSSEELIEKANNIAMSIAQLNIEPGTTEISDKLTVSQGVIIAEPAQDLCFDQLYREVDQNLYLAKESGRNCMAFEGKVHVYSKNSYFKLGIKKG